METLLRIKDLMVRFGNGGYALTAVDNISFDIPRNSFTAIVGESGSGKSATALAIPGLLSKQATVTGSIAWHEKYREPVDLLKLSPAQLRSWRGNKIAMVFQEPMTSLNPVMTCGKQVQEAILQHRKISRKEARNNVLKLFSKVELPDPRSVYSRFPHQLSGGQKQRVMIAMAISCEPSLLIADEPTTALDTIVQKNILQLLKKIQEGSGMSVLLITHDLGLVAEVADEVIVMRGGKIMEEGPAGSLLNEPTQSYTKALLECRPHPGSKGKELPVLKEIGEDDSIFKMAAADKSADHIPSENPLIEVEDLRVAYPVTPRGFFRPREMFFAVNGVSFTINEGETVGLVGESGCGKTSIGRAILQLAKIHSGRISYRGKELSSETNNRKDIQVVFQDPFGSLNPSITIGDALTEPMMVHGIRDTRSGRKDRAMELLNEVGLNSQHYHRYPHEFSGGQRQRICIARALACEPKFLVFDESVSALDVSMQAQVLNLINRLKREHGFTSLFISHDLSVIHYISNRILVMQTGRIMEEGLPGKIMNDPENEYTRKLVSAIPGSGKA